MKSSLMLTVVLVFLTLSSFVFSTGDARETSTGAGTTPGLDQLFKGSCLKFFLPVAANATCERAWTTFREVVASKPPFSFKMSDFLPVFEALNSTAPPNRSTFWSGSGAITHLLSKVNPAYTTLEDTLPSAALDGFRFCPTDPVEALNTAEVTYTSKDAENYSETSKLFSKRDENPVAGFNMQNCTTFVVNQTTQRYIDALGAYWEAASLRFAQTTTGHAHIVFVAAPGRKSYREASIFARIELPNLDVQKVTQLTVLMGTNMSNPEEKCGSGTLLLLEQHVRNHFSSNPSFVFNCINDPKDLTLLRCSMRPTSPECDKFFHPDNTDTENKFKRIIVFMSSCIALGCFILGSLLTLLGAKLTKSCKKKRVPQIDEI